MAHFFQNTQNEQVNFARVVLTDGSSNFAEDDKLISNMTEKQLAYYSELNYFSSPIDSVNFIALFIYAT